MPWLLQPRSEGLKADFSARVCCEVSQKLVASILVAECATLDVSIDSTGPDLTTFTSGGQTTCVRTASAAIRDFVRGQVHAVLFRTEAGDGNSQGLSFRVIGFESGQMDWKTLTVQTAICNHLIHLRLMGRRAWRPPLFQPLRNNRTTQIHDQVAWIAWACQKPLQTSGSDVNASTGPLSVKFAVR